MPSQATLMTAEETMPAVLRRRALEQPDRPFVREVGGATWTFADLDERVAVWSARLRSCGVGEGDRVASVLRTGVDELALWMAASWLGAVEVAINGDLAGELVAHAIRSSGAVVLVTTPELATRLVDSWATAPGLRAVVLTARPEPVQVPAGVQVLVADEIGDGPDARRLEDPPQAHDLAAILFTSGTSGLPKGVLVPWGQVHATAEEVCPPQWWGELDVVYEPYPPFHISGKAPICAMAVRGGEVVLRESFKTDAFFPDVVAHGCTVALLVGGTAQFLLNRPPAAEDRQHPLRVVHMLPLIDRVLEFEERFGVRVCGSFNMTEVSCPIVTGPERLTPAGGAGRLRRYYEARIVDDHDVEVPPGAAGELVLRADRPWTMATGYVGDAEATQAAWRNQWFHTGDLFRQDVEGRFHFVERRSDTVRRRGENVSASFLESVLLQHPEVEQAAVVGIPSSEGESEIMAWIVTPPCVAAQPLLTELADHVLERAAPYMVPRFWRLAPALPLTPTAKVQRSALRTLDHQTWDRLDGWRLLAPAPSARSSAPQTKGP